MRTKNPALIRSQERRDIELKKINTILILPIDKKALRAQKYTKRKPTEDEKQETQYTGKQEGRKKKEDRSRREKKIT